MLRRYRIFAVGVFVLSVWASGLAPAAAATAAPPVRSYAYPTVSAAVSSTTCTGVSFGGQLYCPASISGVKSTAYGIGQRVVLQAVSVTAVTKTSVTVTAQESLPCPAGQYCGATLTTQTLTTSWSKGQPAPNTVVNVFGTTITANLTPVGSQQTATSGCGDFC